jgi:hypothetical protein
MGGPESVESEHRVGDPNRVTTLQVVSPLTRARDLHAVEARGARGSALGDDVRHRNVQCVTATTPGRQVHVAWPVVRAVKKQAGLQRDPSDGPAALDCDTLS